jgi:FkbM family methyltransferase
MFGSPTLFEEDKKTMSTSDLAALSNQPSDLARLRARYEAGEFSKGAYSREIWPLHERLFEYSRFLSDTNVDAIEINREGVFVTLRHPHLKLWCGRRDQRHVAIANLNFGNYEKDETDAVLRIAKVCSTIFDIGANVGFYSIALGKLFPNSRIMAFEPIPDTFRELERNLQLNGVNNVTAFNLGLSSDSRDAQFFFDPTVSGAASGSPLGPEFSTTESLVCPVETLDDLVDRTGIAPDFIKCDVEGGELLVFRGGRKLFEQSKPIVFTEMLRKWAARFHYHPNDIIAFFRDLGYECFVLSGGMFQSFAEMNEETVETNFFFLHSRRHLEMVRFLGLLK